MGNPQPLEVAMDFIKRINAGNVNALTVSTVTLGGTNPQDYTIQSDLCSGQVVPPGGSCTFGIVFTGNVQGTSTATALRTRSLLPSRLR